MPSVFRVYTSPYGITKAQAGPIDSYAVKNLSSSWFNSAGISTTRGAPKVTATQVMRLQDVIYSELVGKAGQLRYLERSLNQAFGRNRIALYKAVVAGTGTYNKVGLTYNGKTYKALYNEYLTMMDAVSYSGGILRSWTRTTLY